MGLLDRDYMRERAEERVRQRDAPPGSRIMLVVLAVTAVLVAGQFYRSHLRHEPVRIGPLQVTMDTGIQTDGMEGTHSATAATVTEEPPIAPPAGLTMQEPVPPTRPFPESGAVQWASPPVTGEPLAILRISDGSDLRGNKVIRLRDAFGDMLLQVYVRDQEGAVIQVPPGRYQISVMIGSSWYGPHRQFGPGATYFRGRAMVVGSAGSDYLLLPTGVPGVTGMAGISPSAF